MIETLRQYAPLMTLASLLCSAVTAVYLVGVMRGELNELKKFVHLVIDHFMPWVRSRPAVSAPPTPGNGAALSQADGWAEPDPEFPPQTLRQRSRHE